MIATASTQLRKSKVWMLRFIALGALVGVACWGSIAFTRVGTPVATVWAASGLLTGVLLSSERHAWTGFLVAALAGNLVAHLIYGEVWYIAIGLSAASVAEASIVAFTLVHFVGDLNNPAKGKLVGMAAVSSNLVASAVSSVVAASTFAIAGVGPFTSVLATWFVAHVLGMGIFATLTAVALYRGRRLLGKPGRRLDFAITLTLLAVVCLAVFTHSQYSLSFLIFAPLLYCIFRNGFDGVVLGIAVIVVISITLTLANNESAQLAVGFKVGEDVILLQLFLTVVCLVAYPVAIVLTESRGLMRGLRESQSALAQQNTELQALNEKLIETQNQLLQSEKMASVGQLAAGVAHEINNPIGYVRSNLKTLTDYVQKIFSVLDGYERAEKAFPPASPEVQAVRTLKQEMELGYIRDDVANLLNESVEGATRIEKIVKDLRDFSRVDEVEWQRADVRECINSTLNVIAHEIKCKGEVVKQYGDLPRIQCQPLQLQQVFLNVLVNAAHAIERTGTITIRTGIEGDHIWITFSDTGKGIDASHIGRIFEPFFTTKPVGGGTGLGLSVSYGIIKNHGGTMGVTSVLGKGTTFTIRLPIDGPGVSRATAIQ